VAARITLALAAPVRTDDALVYTSGGTGSAISRSPHDTALSLLRDADAAMYRAKAAGPGSVALFDSEMRAGVRERAAMEHHLRSAVERGELHLEYQPIVDLVSGRVVAAEALARWDSPELGRVGPDEFIPLAEEIGAIVAIGEWVLDDAARQLRTWLDEGVVRTWFRVGVNVSASQLSTRFHHVVVQALHAHQLGPDQLTLEITESALIESGQPSVTVVEDLHELGVRLALDDFGTGFSSLSLLQRFPIQRIKIDRAFVQGIADRSNDRSLVRTIIAMGQSMGLDLVAEGVETVHQLQGLRDLGCDKAQGYLISRPVPAEAMRSTMVALDELTGLALFANDIDQRASTTPERWLEPVGVGSMTAPMLRPLATRPLG